MQREEITQKLNEVFNKWKAWADDIPSPIFNEMSWSDNFYLKIKNLLREELEKQHCFFGSDLHLPSRYLVQIGEIDRQNFQGEKFTLLRDALDRFLRQEFRRLGVETLELEVQIESSSNLGLGDVNVTSCWRETYSPQIRFNSQNDFDNLETIIAPSFWQGDAETPTVVRKKMFSLEICREGENQDKNIVPVFQSAITIGRSVQQHISLLGDDTISRHHLDLAYQGNDSFKIVMQGQNPIFLREREMPLFKGQTEFCQFGDVVEIGSYSIKIQN